jgi:putative ABC transport system permease protein
VIEPSGYIVGGIGIPGINSDPGQHWAQNQINGFVLVLQVMSVLAIFLSGGLVVNTISAILGQQIKQIGIMRSVGAIRRQLIGMYVANVIVYSIAGLIVGLPLGLFGAWWLTSFAASYLNFDVAAITLDPLVTGIQIAVGLAMPMAVALYPITAGTQISIYDAIYQYGLSSEGDGGWLESTLSKLRKLHPPIMLALRNTFRKKMRLAFTLVTLTLAGAMFMSVFSTRASLTEQITQVSRYVDFDASLNLVGGITRTTAEREALRIPGVTVAEGWSAGNGIIIHEDGSEGEGVQLNGIPPNSQTREPLLIFGRWLEVGDSQQIVVNEDLLEKEPQAYVGSTIVLKVNEVERSYQVVGVVSKHLSGPRAYMTYGMFAKAADRSNQADMVRIRLSPTALSSPAEQKLIGQILQTRFQDAGLSTGTSRTHAEIFSDFSGPFDIILIVLIVMAGLLAVVGGLSLTGTMGMNVMERTREIGVLRALGANNVAIRQVVVIEGVVVGAMSWLFSALVSGPAGFVLAGAVVGAVLRSQVSYRYSVLGLGIWLLVVSLIGVFASLAPARSAAQLTVREVLDYE